MVLRQCSVQTPVGRPLRMVSKATARAHGQRLRSFSPRPGWDGKGRSQMRYSQGLGVNGILSYPVGAIGGLKDVLSRSAPSQSPGLVGVQPASATAARSARPCRASALRRPGCRRCGLAAPLGGWAGRQARRGHQRRPLQLW